MDIKIKNTNKWLISLSFIICHLSISVTLTSCSDFLDVLPLSLEEIFIYELGGTEHEIKNILL